MSEAEPLKQPNLLRRLYAWTQGWATHRSATVALFFIAFVEAFIFPVPPDVLLMALCGAQPRRSLWFATVCTLGSVLGGVVGYFIGYALIDLGQWILTTFASEATIESVKTMVQENGFWTVLISAFTPIPDKVSNVLAGFCEVSIPIFLVAYLIGRAARFFLVSGTIYLFGPRLMPFIEKHIEWVTLALAVLVIAGFVSVKFLAS